jgi:hypothetical protein
LIIGSNPARFRPLMIPAIVEKLGHVATLIVLFSRARIPTVDAQAAVQDGVLGLLLVAAFVRTSSLGVER